IRIIDTDFNTSVPLTDANLNAYLRFDDSAWDWGPIPTNERGTFNFELLPDAAGNPNRVIGLNYSPVPEPSALILVAVGLGGWFRRRFARHSTTRLAIVFLICLVGSTHAQTFTWTGLSNNGDWNTTGNWSPFGIPNSATAAVNFTGNALGTVNISTSSVQAQ